MQIWQEKTNMYGMKCMTFPCIIAWSSIVRWCKWPSLSRRIVEIQKFGYHGNVTSHFSTLSRPQGFSVRECSLHNFKTVAAVNLQKKESDNRCDFFLWILLETLMHSVLSHFIIIAALLMPVSLCNNGHSSRKEILFRRNNCFIPL